MEAAAGPHVPVPAGARWAVVDRGSYRVAYDVSGVEVVPVWWDAGGLFGTVRLLDAEGGLLAERAIGP